VHIELRMVCESNSFGKTSKKTFFFNSSTVTPSNEELASKAEIPLSGQESFNQAEESYLPMVLGWDPRTHEDSDS
jgi:hypothetical protein